MRRFAAEGEGDGAGDRVHRLAGPTLVPLGEYPEQQGEGTETKRAEIEQLAKRADVQTVPAAPSGTLGLGVSAISLTTPSCAAPVGAM